jgi:cellulose synthase/poly-beta-1,6-N-acetylglucosamine synthase-like glycosyltransferase
MSELVAYPFLFLAIFFESFVLVTLLSRPARAARTRAASIETPSVAIVVPCYNEAATVSKTVQSLLALEYPKEKLEIILVNDGSTDETPQVMSQYESHSQITVIHKKNGGKHTALNAGIAATSAKLVGCLDADSFVEPDALREIIPCFRSGRVGAVTGAMSVHVPQTLIQHMQNVEYIFGITFRHAIASVNGLYVTPGPFSFYRRSVLLKLGAFRNGHQTEDMEMALRIQQAGYEIENAPKARVYTKAPSSVLRLVKQRTRWTSGFLRNIFGEYRGLIGSRRHGALGMLMLPTALLAIASGMLLFAFVIFDSLSNAITALEIRSGVPLSYSLVPHTSFDWFYAPTNLYMALAVVALTISYFLVFVGKRISKTPGNLTLGLVFYLFYGLIVPLWLFRAASDVVLGKQRVWK